MDEGNVCFFLGFIAIAVVLMIVGWHQRQARQSALRHLAMELGWSFDHGDARVGGDGMLSTLLGLDGGGGGEYHAFAIFNRGRDRRAYNTLQGVLNLPGAGGAAACPAIAGDFRYTTGSGKNRRTSHFSYLIVRLPVGPVPELVVRPEGFFDQVASFVGYDDIDFESAAFSDAFHVKGSDKRFAWDLCDARMMQFLLETRPDMFELEGHYLCVSPGRGRWRPEDFHARIAWTQRFVAQWPRHLVDSLAPRESHAALTWGAQP